jgi:hypothetical protein
MHLAAKLPNHDMLHPRKKHTQLTTFKQLNNQIIIDTNMAEQDFDDGHSFSAGLSIDSHDADPSSSQMPTLSASEWYVVDALPSVSPIDSRPSVVWSCVSSSFESHESPLPGSAFLRDPCPLLCPSCQIGSGCLCSSGRHPGTSSDQEILALTDHLGSSHDFHLIGLSSSPSDGSRLASS